MKKLWYFRPVALVLLLLLLASTAASWFFATDKLVFFAELALLLLAVVYVLWDTRRCRREIRNMLERASTELTPDSQEALERFPIPTLTADEEGSVLWYNELLHRLMFEPDDAYGRNLTDIFNTAGWHEACRPNGMDVRIGGRRYTVYGTLQPTGNYLFFFYENTELKRKSEEYDATRPSVLLIAIDNYDELQSARESEKARLLIGTERLLEQFIQSTNGFLRKLDRDKYLAVVEERHMSKLIETRFPVLDQVREQSAPGEMQITLSIGIGRAAPSFGEAEQQARMALDMCLGRGGDQVAVKTAGGYDFYGGVSRGVEKKTKVKTRIVATALHDLILAADNVVLMGHRFSDLDATGAAIGLCRACRELGKPAHVATYLGQSLATPLIERLVAHGYGDYFEEPEDLFDRITKKTLLIVVDTHIHSFLESPELYKRVKTVAVIDHHRKMVGHIDNATIFYHEPFASSASEMVTELVQYLTDRALIGRYEAEALLSGIMLDTKNFVMRTGVRTFEAAAYLRRLGADTVEVKKLFASSMDSYQKRARIMAQAEVYRRCAISLSDDPSPDMRIAAPQAADEMLSISDVDASFVLFRTNEGVSLSARSMGGMNVQIIVEKLGGGGHQSMAGAQFKDANLSEVRERLLREIDNYYAGRPQPASYAEQL